MTDVPFSQPAAVLLHVGAGPLLQLDTYLDCPDMRVVILEADPARVRHLEERTASCGHIHILHGFPALSDGELEVQIFNLPDLVSAAPPTGLTTLFPGLRVLQRPVVPAVSPQALLKALGPLHAPAELVMDTPGAPAGWLGAFGTDALQGFDRITLRAAPEEIFAGGATLADETAVLAAAGFTETGVDMTDPDWPVSHFHLDRKALEITRLTAALQEADEARQTAVNHTAELEGTLAQTSATLKDRSDKLAELQKALDDQTALANDRAAQIRKGEEQATDKLRSRDARIGELEKAVADKTAALDERSNRVKALEAEAAKASETLQARNARVGELEKAVATGEARLKTMAEEKASKEKLYQQGRTELSLALRMQAFHANDLQDLRLTHADLVAQKQRQDVLIGQLATRLTAASDHLKALSLQQIGQDAPQPAPTVPPDVPQVEEPPQPKARKTRKPASGPRRAATKPAGPQK